MKNISFDGALNSYQSDLKRFASKFTNNDEDANDLVQETFIKALRYSELYQDGTNMGAWLYTIMKNTFINNCRKLKMRREIIKTTEDIPYYDLVKSAAKNSGVDTLTGDDIDKALQNLDKAYLTPFLRFFEGYKYYEIADELSIPIGTVKTRIHQARKMLKSSLKMYKVRET